jgi:outer membrane receptor protein involved in Fe transport
LIEDDSVRSKATTILNGEVGYKFSPRLRLTLEGYNLADAQVSDIDYYFASRLQNEPAPVDDIHFHAAIPRSVRLALQVSF